jgi:hypothetical protein
VAILPRTDACVFISLLGLLSCGTSALAAAAEQPTNGDLPVSLGRIRAAVEEPAAHSLEMNAPLPLPVPRFKTTAEQRIYMLSFEQQLHKDLELTPLQRQSQEWGSRCCGLDLDVLFKPIERALQRRKERKIRRQIAQELEQLKAAGRQ